MNAPLPNHVTSPAKQPALPDAWVERLFDHMASLYGSKFADLWRSTDPAKVRAMWADKLAGFADKPQAIKAALDALDERPFPPTLPEFIALCRDAARRMGSAQAALPHKMTREDHERVSLAAREAKRAVERANMDKVKAWATHPRSHLHIRFITDAARNDPEFQRHVDTMVESGVCTPEGHALKLYRGGTWVPVHRPAA